jgi:uncharacterized membrane protein
MGGFFDGILFHQILQLHNMLSSLIPVQNLVSAKINMLWDGYFHAGVWLITLFGIHLLHKAGKNQNFSRSHQVLIGSMLAGWGAFNLIEGTVNHQLLGIHHVMEYVFDPLPYDLAFLASGVLLIIVGWRLVKHKEYQRSAL